MSSSDAVTLGEIADRLAMLEVACSRCERRGRLSVAKLIERPSQSAARRYSLHPSHRPATTPFAR
jgi:hypothetical protein